MDVLSELLREIRADGSVLLRADAPAPGGHRLEGAPLTFVLVLEGEVWIGEAPGRYQHLGRGDAAVLRGPEPFGLADDVAALAAPVGLTPFEDGAGGAAPAGPGGTTLLVGRYRAPGHASQRVLSALPRLVIQPGSCDGDPDYGAVVREAAREAPGRQVVLDRLFDWLLVCTLRTWFSRSGVDAPSWYRALSDPVVGPALQALHADPARQWTVAGLAAEAGVSRASLARRFRQLVEQPPMAYLAAWRLTLAADLLTTSSLTLEAIARRVGYADAFSFSAAFKRVRGCSPSLHRAGTSQRAGTHRRSVAPTPG